MHDHRVNTLAQHASKQGMVRNSTLLTLFITLFVFGLSASVSRAETIEHRNAKFTVYRFDPRAEKLELFLRNDQNQSILTFRNLEKYLNAKGRRLKLAVNSGIYEPGFIPSGLHISEGRTLVKLNLKTVPAHVSPKPNFYLQPNGVFFIRSDGTAAVLASRQFSGSGEKPLLATQSGPLLVANGRIHPIFEKNSTSRLLRNGIGVDRKGRVVIACSHRLPNTPGRINLHGFAELFRDKLTCPNALYLDGDISDIFLRGESRTIPVTTAFAGILAITEPIAKTAGGSEQ